MLDCKLEIDTTSVDVKVKERPSIDFDKLLKTDRIPWQFKRGSWLPLEIQEIEKLPLTEVKKDVKLVLDEESWLLQEAIIEDNKLVFSGVKYFNTLIDQE